MMAWRQAGVSLPHSSALQATYGTRITAAQLPPGDLVFYHVPISHVALYVGQNLMLDAPQTGDVVKIHALRPGMTAAVRPVAPAAPHHEVTSEITTRHFRMAHPQPPVGLPRCRCGWPGGHARGWPPPPLWPWWRGPPAPCRAAPGPWTGPDPRARPGTAGLDRAAAGAAFAPSRAEVAALLQRRSDAVRRGDRGEWLATLDPASGAFRTRQAALFDRLRLLPITRWSYQPPDPGRWQPVNPSSAPAPGVGSLAGVRCRHGRGPLGRRPTGLSPGRRHPGHGPGPAPAAAPDRDRLAGRRRGAVLPAGPVGPRADRGGSRRAQPGDRQRGAASGPAPVRLRRRCRGRPGGRGVGERVAPHGRGRGSRPPPRRWRACSVPPRPPAWTRWRP